MSSNYWQIIKQGRQFKPGKCATEKITNYVTEWKRRCYSTGIPDEVPRKLHGTGRVPSYKEIAELILKNDLAFTGLGLATTGSDRYHDFMRGTSAQGQLF